MSIRRVYLAGPIAGLGYDACTNWRDKASDRLRDYFIAGVSPMRGKGFLKEETEIKQQYNDVLQGSSDWINTRDYNDVRRCDAVLVNFVGSTKVSIGTVLEIGFAKALNKPIIIAMEPGNVHEHVMIHNGSTVIVPTIEDATEAMIDLLTP